VLTLMMLALTLAVEIGWLMGQPAARSAVPSGT
jgi:hypothetical protein